MRCLWLALLLFVGAAQAALEETDWLDLMPESDQIGRASCRERV